MKRLVWLILFAFGTALAQVQPVDMPVKPQAACGCCEAPGACGMPDCAPAPVAAQPIMAQAGAGQRTEARRVTPAVLQKREHFYVQFMPRASRVPAFRASSRAAAPAGEPLFKVHCSFLI